MRNFDFSKLKINHLLGQTSFRHLGYSTCFQALAWNIFGCSSSARTKFRRLIFLSQNFQLVQSNGPIEPG